MKEEIKYDINYISFIWSLERDYNQRKKYSEDTIIEYDNLRNTLKSSVELSKSIGNSMKPIIDASKQLVDFGKNISTIKIPEIAIPKIEEKTEMLFIPPRNYEAEKIEELKKINKKLDNNSNNKKLEIIKGIDLNENNGIISFNGVIIGSVNLQTQPGKMFLFLFKNKGIYKDHKEIVLGVYGKKQTTQKTCQALTSDWKKKIDKEVRKHIKSQKGGYILMP